MEACFLLKEGMYSDGYSVDTVIPADESLSEALDKAFTVEETVQKAYGDAAILSEGLMADIPGI